MICGTGLHDQLPEPVQLDRNHDDLNNRVIDHLDELRDGNGHVSNLVQELHGPQERPQHNHELVDNLVQELHNAACRRP